MVNFIVWLVVGGIIGWVASRLTGQKEGLLLDIVVGIVGAFIAGWILTPLLHIGTINQNNFSMPALTGVAAGRHHPAGRPERFSPRRHAPALTVLRLVRPICRAVCPGLTSTDWTTHSSPGNKEIHD